MLFPQSFMDNLRARLSVSQVIGQYLPLRRHGREYMALCPFHQEKTPSFTINDAKGFYHCFGCGAHGDAIGFVKDYEKIGYREAVAKLAAQAGIALPQPSREHEARERSRRGAQEVAEAACRWFQAQLAGAGGSVARDYLARRGVAPAIGAQFRLGYAPDDREALTRAMKTQGISETQLIAAGLLIAAEGRAPYARFRGRLMFPILDRHGEVVGFGGRLLAAAGGNAPKYLNSPDSDLFHKGLLLYHFDRARRAAQDSGQLVLCEGYMDVIALAQAGIDQAVAPLGTAVTAEQLQLAWSCCDAPILCLDGDAAGQRAMARVCELALPLLKPGKSLLFARLPAGEDPDSLVKSQGKAAFEAILAQAAGLADTLLAQTLATSAPTPEARAAQERHLLQLADRIADAGVRAHYRRYFRDKLWEHGRAAAPVKPSAPAASLPPLPAVGDLAARRERAARACLAICLLYPDLLRAGAYEETLACLPLSGPLAALRDAALRLCLEGDIGRDALHAALLAEGYAQALRQCLEQPALPPGLRTDPDGAHRAEAERLFADQLQRHELLALEDELIQAQCAFAASKDEAALNRLIAVKTQLAEAEAQRAMREQAALLARALAE